MPAIAIQTSLKGIWGNPMGLKVSEIDENMYQIMLDREIDLKRIIKGNPWIIRNTWFVVHNWERNVKP